VDIREWSDVWIMLPFAFIFLASSTFDLLHTSIILAIIYKRVILNILTVIKNIDNIKSVTDNIKNEDLIFTMQKKNEINILQIHFSYRIF